jgi:hypothetical protein
VTKTDTLIGVSRAIVSTVKLAYINHEKTKSAKRNKGRKPTLTERDRFTLRKTVSENNRTTAAQVKGQSN